MRKDDKMVIVVYSCLSELKKEGKVRISHQRCDSSLRWLKIAYYGNRDGESIVFSVASVKDDESDLVCSF